LACKFTVGELAALRIVSDEVREKGHCDRTLGEISARAGISRTTAQNAMRLAAAMGLLTVQERRREGQKNLPNVVRIVSREWQLWIKRGGQRNAPQVYGGIGFKKTDPTDKGFKRRGESGIPPGTSEPRFQPQSTWETREKAIGKAGRVSAPRPDRQDAPWNVKAGRVSQ
jgi:hypothetical protein